MTWVPSWPSGESYGLVATSSQVQPPRSPLSRGLQLTVSAWFSSRTRAVPPSVFPLKKGKTTGARSVEANLHKRSPMLGGPGSIPDSPNMTIEGVLPSISLKEFEPSVRQIKPSGPTLLPLGAIPGFVRGRQDVGTPSPHACSGDGIR